MASDKTKTKHNNFSRNFIGKDMEPFNNKARLELNKKTAVLKNWLIFLKTINFKVLKTFK